ncbi:MAG: pitrilysin family protein, partial [Rhodospirillales bacterium]|nr:pitrilysin family protein [Rhodospirillales bacterium]
NDYTGYHQSVAVDRLPLVMRMEADRMRNLVLAPGEIEPERQVVLEERRSRTDNSPRARLYEQMNAALYLNHPYRNPIIGWEHEIRAIGMDDLKSFYKKWYAPNNAILVVAGDITLEKLRPLAEKYYGGLKPSKGLERIRTQEPPPGAARRIALRDRRVRQPSWRRAYLAPSHGYGDKAHLYSLEVLAEIFGSGSTSRLYRSMVIGEKLAVSARAGYDAGGLGPSTFSIGASPLPGISMEKLEAGIDAQIALLVEKGVTEKETERAKQRLIDGAVFARDSLRAGARVLGGALSSGMKIEDVENWPERIGAVTADRIKAAARAVFKKRASVTGLLLPPRAKKSAGP